MACGVLVPQLGIKPTPPAVEALDRQGSPYSFIFVSPVGNCLLPRHYDSRAWGLNFSLATVPSSPSSPLGGPEKWVEASPPGEEARPGLRHVGTVAARSAGPPSPGRPPYSTPCPSVLGGPTDWACPDPKVCCPGQQHVATRARAREGRASFQDWSFWFRADGCHILHCQLPFAQNGNP